MSCDHDVVVVGGGPVGVATALLAARRGLSAAVLERSTEIYDLPRAIVLDDECQRVFQGAGIIEGLHAITTPIRGGEFLGPDGNRAMGIELPDRFDWPLGHRPAVAFYQPELEAFIRAKAIEAGVDLHLGHEVTGVGQGDDGAWAEVVRDDGRPDRHDARWVVAADGAASPTRKRLGIAFNDLGFDQDWLVIDARLKRPDVELPLLAQQICEPERPATFVPGHGAYRRWEFQLQAGESAGDLLDTDTMWRLLARWVGPDDIQIVRAVVYRFHATVAARMREGRVFLAGDAAHQMPPFLGQGLNSGLRDATNLAWKLAEVSAGRAGDRLLDSYDQERRPHAEGVVAHAIDAGLLIDQLAGRADAGVSIDSAYGGQRPFPHLRCGVLAGDHLHVGRQLPQPNLHGSPLDELLGNGFAVLVRADDPVAEAARGSTEALHARLVTVPGCEAAGRLVPEGGAVIVRPDRYVAAVAASAAELAERTDELLGWFARPECAVSAQDPADPPTRRWP